MIDAHNYLTYEEVKNSITEEDKTSYFRMFYYNCGGYALGTYTWVIPIEDWDVNPFNISKTKDNFYSEAEMEEITKFCVDVLLNEVENLREVASFREKLAPNETLIAFRISNDGDFHFMRKEGKKWKHKRGNTPKIEAFNGAITKPWFNRYNGPLVLFALKEE